MGRNLRLNIDIICLVLFLSFGIQTINAQNCTQNPVEIINLIILGESDIRQWQIETIISQPADSGDSILWRSGAREYSGSRFHFINLGALLNGETYSFLINVFSTDSGWSVEESISFTMNTPPTTPQIGLQKPPVFESIHFSFPIVQSDDLQIPSSDLFYHFQITGNSSGNDLQLDTLLSASIIQTNQNRIPVTTILPDNSTYYARIRSSDGVEYSPWSKAQPLHINRINDIPDKFDLVFPVGGDTLIEVPTLTWRPAIDPDAKFGKGISKHVVEYSIDPSFKYLVKTAQTSPQFTNLSPGDFENHRTYHWRVTAIDHGGLKRTSNQSGSFTLNLGNLLPPVPVIISPRNGQVLSPEQYIIWQFEDDPDKADRLSFDIIILNHDTKEPVFIEHLSDTLVDVSRFRLVSDFSVGYNNLVRYQLHRIDLSKLIDGHYYDFQLSVFDNWGGEVSTRESAYFRYDDNMNKPPQQPLSGFFPDSAIIKTQHPVFRWHAAYDPDVSDQLRYRVQISQDRSFSGTKFILQDIPYNHTRIRLKTALLENAQYYWRIQSIDLEESISSWSSIHTFWINRYNEPPSGPVKLILPRDLMEIGPEAGFWWESCGDPDPGDTILYIIEIDNSSIFRPPLISIRVPALQTATWLDTLTPLPSKGISVFLHEIPGKSRLKDNQMYYWRVFAEDKSRIASPPMKIPQRFIYNSQNDPPETVTGSFSPSNGEIIKSQTPLIRWSPARDPDFSDLHLSISYQLELSDAALFPERKTRIFTTGAGENFFQITDELIENAKWFYRVRAIDSHGALSAWSTINSFITNQIQERPFPVTAGFLPKDSMVVETPTPLISWTPTTDPDPGQSDRNIYYITRYFLTEKPKKHYYGHSDLGVPGIQLPHLKEDVYYGYQIAVIDPDGKKSDWSTIQYFGVNASDNPPKYFQLLSPRFYEDSIRTEAHFMWQTTTDKDLASEIKYILFYGSDSLFQTNTNEIVLSSGDSATVLYSPMGNLNRQTKYFWKVVAVDNSGKETWASNSNQNPFVFTTIGDRRHYDESAPTNYVLHQNYPNPFNRITTIRYEISEFGSVDVTIYDILGKRIKTIASGDHSPGVYEALWDGTDSYGVSVPGGMYLCRMSTRNYTSHKKVLLMK
jgi:hypothetical protein